VEDWTYFLNLALVVLGMNISYYINVGECGIVIHKVSFFFRDVAGGAVIVREAGGVVFDP